jgi:hypothetical protein
MAASANLAQQKQQEGEGSMSVLSDDSRRSPADRTAKQRRFWHGLAERLDALAAYPTKHAISEQELRKVDDDIKRCRQLMFKKPQRQRAAKLGRLSMSNAVGVIKTR